MKHTIITALLAITGATALTLVPAVFAGTHKRASAPVVITRPAIPSGSNWSRAPFPAARPNDDVTPPNGEAFDQNVPPNTPATTPDPIAPPVAQFAILQPRTPVAPGLMPTGRPTVGAAMALESARIDPMIRNASFENRDNIVDDVRVRMHTSEVTLAEFRQSKAEMSATGRSQFESLHDEVKARRKALEKSARAAANANSADWDAARAQLAADYQAYAASVSRLDAAVGIR
jgi:hypothetical protein